MTLTTSTSAWFTSPRPNPDASLRLFCFPYAGGAAHIYRTWPEGLPASVEVCTAQLPGRGTRMKEAPFTDLMQMVAALAQAVTPYLDRPFAIFGHSMGALISFELARLLRDQQRTQPAHLFLSGRRAPHTPHEAPITYNLPEPELLAEVRRLNGTPPEVFEHPELLELLLPLLRADFSVVETYRYTPGPPLNCPITVMGGEQDGEVPREHLEGWREYTTSSFSLHMLPGNHFFLYNAQSQLLRLIAQQLELR